MTGTMDGTDRGSGGRGEGAQCDPAGSWAALWSLVANVEALLLDVEAELLAAARGPTEAVTVGGRSRGPVRRPGRATRRMRYRPPGRRCRR